MKFKITIQTTNHQNTFKTINKINLHYKKMKLKLINMYKLKEWKSISNQGQDRQKGKIVGTLGMKLK